MFSDHDGRVTYRRRLVIEDVVTSTGALGTAASVLHGRSRDRAVVHGTCHLVQRRRLEHLQERYAEHDGYVLAEWEELDLKRIGGEKRMQ